MPKHDALYPLILAEVPGCPLMTVKTALNRAAADFCTGSLAWQEDLDPIFVAAGIAEYDLDVPAGSQLVVIREGEVKLNGRKLLPIKAPAAIDPAVTGLPSHYAQRDYGALLLYPKPTEAAGSLTVRAVLKPTLTATTLPDILIDRYYEAVTEGAKAFLKRMPNQPWTDPPGAATAYALHSRRTAEARVSAEMGLVAGSMQMKPRAYGR